MSKSGGLKKISMDLKCSSMDLGKLAAMNDYSQKSKHANDSGRKQLEEGTRGLATFLDDCFLCCVVLLRVIVALERSLREVVDQILFNLESFFSNVLSNVFAYGSIASPNSKKSTSTIWSPSAILQAMLDEDLEDDEPLSPSKVTPASSSNTADEWGHFTDFQEELADESIVTSTFTSNTESGLGTLEETEEEDEPEFF
jgi:hypothetical protein